MSLKIYYLENNKLIFKTLKINIIIPIPIVKLLSVPTRLVLSQGQVILLSKETLSKQYTQLSLLLSSNRTKLTTVLKILSLYEIRCREQGYKGIRATVINKRISKEILAKYQWKFISKNWYIGDNYYKNI